MKLYLNILFFIIIPSIGLSQHSIQSRVFDEKSSEAIELATVRLLNPNDSSLVKGAQTDVRGGFILDNVPQGKYILVISSIGYYDYTYAIAIENKNLVLKNIQLKENAQLLSEIEVKGTAAQLVVKGDTMEYNATAFKTAENAVVEDLLKRLPGIEISQEGTITVNGEEIKKIRVDGKKFFDGDTEMATKNLPAEMIDKIQVIDQKSDMAKLTGFEDEETERIINLTTKANRKRGVFSNINGGIGLDTENIVRYNAHAVANFMLGESQTTVTGGANNVNNSRSMRGRISGGDGTTDSQNIGVNNNTVINDKLVIGGNASFNHSANQTITDNYKLSYLRDSTYTDSTFSISNKENFNTNFRFELEWKPDSLNTIIIQPSFNYTRSYNDNSRDFIYLVEDDTTSVGNNLSYGENSDFTTRINVLYNRKFNKKGRTLTTNFNTDFSNSKNDSYNYSYRTGISNDTIDQFTINNSDRFNMNLRISFVEPLWNENNLLEASVSFLSSLSNSKKDQYDNYYLRYYDDVNEYTDFPRDYSLFNEEYSNDFKSRLFKETFELNYRYNEKDYNITLGVRVDPSQTFSHTTYGNGDERNIVNKIVNFSPTGRFRYNFGKRKFIRVDYRGNMNQPSISQMQPVKNNSNLMNETIGNPSLNPAFTHRLVFLYSTFNETRISSFSTSINLNYTQNALVTNTIYDNTGKRYNQTVNSKSAPFNINANVMYNTPIIQKRLHFNTSTNFGLNQRYGYSSTGHDVGDGDIVTLPLGEKSSTQVYSVQEQISFTFTHETIEIGTRGRINYRKTMNNLNTAPSDTWDFNVDGNIVLHLPYNINISTDINYITRKGYSNFDRNELIWNASVDKNFFKNRGVLSLQFSDILRQRQNIRQSVGDNYMQFSRSNTLTSYFLVSFSYKINRFGGKEVDPKTLPNGEKSRKGPGRPIPML